MSPTAPPAYFREVVVAGSCWYGKVSVCKRSIQSQKAYYYRQDERPCHWTPQKALAERNLQSPEQRSCRDVVLPPHHLHHLPQPMYKDVRQPILYGFLFASSKHWPDYCNTLKRLEACEKTK